MIVFIRTVVQLYAGTSRGEVELIDRYLHYDRDKGDFLEMKDILSLMTSHGISAPDLVTDDMHYCKFVCETADKAITNGTFETDLDIKIAVGLAIRLLWERFYVKTILSNGGNVQGIDAKRIARELESRGYNFIDAADCAVLKSAKLIADPLVHVNSMMYEPLIDVSPQELIDAYKDVKDLNSKWEI